MAFPVVETTAETAVSTAGTSHAITLPSGIVSGDLILIVTARGVAVASFNALSGWTELVDDGVANGVTVWYRKADGTEGATVTFTSSANTRSATIAYRISGAEDPATQPPQINTVTTGSSVSPDPGNLTPAGGAKDYLWIALFARSGEEADDDTWVTAAPASFNNLLQKACGVAGTNLGGMVATAQRNLNAASLDAGAFTVATGGWRAHTIAVHPAASVAHDPGTQADALGITDSVDVSLGLSTAPADSVGVTDASAFGVGLAAADALGVTDATDFAATFERTNAETLDITDSAAAGILKTQDVNDALGITDARAFELGPGLVDALSVGDATDLAVGRERTVADALGVTDAAGTFAELVRLVEDGLGLADTQALAAEYTRTVGDALGVTDLAAPAGPGGIERTIADALGITDATVVDLVAAVFGLIEGASSIGAAEAASSSTGGESLTGSMGQEGEMDLTGVIE